MESPSRQEIDAKLDSIENRVDRRVTPIEASLDAFMEVMNERTAGMDERARRADARMDRLEATVESIKLAVSSLKTTVIVTAITAVLATVFGVAAFNATVLSNMIASFQAGMELSSVRAEMKQQAQDTAALIREMRDDLEQHRKERTDKK